MSSGREHPLVLTGERTLPGIPAENYWFARHVAAYEHAAALLAPGREPGTRDAGPILDSGSGEGYGTAILANRLSPAFVTGLDSFPDAVTHAGMCYPEPAFVCADGAAVPLREASCAAVVSLQVIEHMPDPAAYVAECRRLIRPGGVAVIGTPNRLTFTPPGRPTNPFHIVEFSADELAGLLAEWFASVRLEGVHDSHPGLADALVDAALTATEPPAWAREQVARVTPADFTIRDADPACLDLIATCRT
ncbi:MAG: class I SAM-dependent methyltransferase [Acidimicrobiia bacterium]|nr:class I SAM-dependent methyltransferase [Acidimicrobiia bacterium]